MRGIPLIKGRAEPLSQHEACGLSDQGHRHLPITDIQIQGACAMPSQSLVVIEKLLNVPSLRVMDRELFQFISIASTEEGFKVVIFWAFPFALNELVVGALMAPHHRVRLLGGRIPCPMPMKRFIRNLMNRS